MSATVTPNYSHGRRKFGRPPKVHHWDIACDECPGVNLRPSRFWEPKKRLLEIAAEHNRVAHPVLSALDGAARLALPDREMLRRPARDLLRSLPLSEPHARGTPCATCDAREEAVIDTILAALREGGMG